MFQRGALSRSVREPISCGRGLSSAIFELTFDRAMDTAPRGETFAGRGFMTGSQKSQADDSETTLAAGDASVWLADHGDVLYRYARSRVANRQAAEDLVQDALLAALQSRERFEGRATVRTWLLSILRHKIIDHGRRAATAVSAADVNSHSRAGGVRERYFSVTGFWKKAVASWRKPEQALEDREFWDVLDGCLGRLPSSLATPFVLREIDELDSAELRRILGVSEVNLRVRLHRARLLLRECLEKHWFGVDTSEGTRNNP
jgi:RNA polymerase sigma-70 factor, ECF subfamily